MQFDTYFFLTGFFIAILVASDALLVGVLGKWMGFLVEEIALFHGVVLKREIRNTIWQLGYLPLGSFVRFRGLAREDEDESVEPGDFDQQSLGKQVFLLLLDKLVLVVVLLVALLLAPQMSWGDGLAKAWEQIVFILSQSPGEVPAGGAPSISHLLATVSLFMLFMALIPSMNKTQILLLLLMGLYNKFMKNGFLQALFYLTYLIFFYVLYCLYLFASQVFPGEGLAILVNVLGGMLLVGLVYGLLIDAFGKRLDSGEKL